MCVYRKKRISLSCLSLTISRRFSAAPFALLARLSVHSCCKTLLLRLSLQSGSGSIRSTLNFSGEHLLVLIGGRVGEFAAHGLHERLLAEVPDSASHARIDDRIAEVEEEGPKCIRDNWLLAGVSVG